MAFLGISVSNFTVNLPGRLFNATNASQVCTFSVISVLQQRLNMFLISVALCLVGTLLANPLLVVLILLTKRFRQETRYVLLANILVADLIFLLLNSLISISVSVQQCMPTLLCDVAVIGRIVSELSSVITITVMAIDTYVAVSFPLRYLSLISPSRTIKLIILIWILASMYPLILLSAILAKQPALTHGHKMCLMLPLPELSSFDRHLILEVNIFLLCIILLFFPMVLYCYVMLYVKTRSSGIWDSVKSRARMTLLIHGIVLFLYFVPCLIFSFEIVFRDSQLIGLSDRIWLHSINIYVFMMLPRLLCPYLYGLRYRELAEAVKRLLTIRTHRVHVINT
ncbi:probable G-protein coupled receptor 148 [Hemiscyllium ocellatum]|uniref:probable G-protein coupled receptor 148 n=1 Tax=Hemiscyllium ocellatum TaxID=170820 RepID=UPI002966619B|nr:probable G-protein coupled receptor 148 [Hemiscyllium ocellatum]